MFCQHILKPHIPIGETFDVVAVLFLTRQCEQSFANPGKVFLNVGDNDLLDTGFRLNLLESPVEQAQRNSESRSTVANLKLHFSRRIGWVGSNHDSTSFEDSVETDDECGAVWHDNSNWLAFLQPHLDQSGCQRI